MSRSQKPIDQTVHFCQAPFRSTYLNNGVARPCCWFDKKQLENRNTTIQDLQSTFHSHDFEQVRELMRSDLPVPACQKCYKHEKAGGESHRQMWNKRKFDKDSIPSGDLTADLKALDLNLGNLCNLKCVMCDSYNSTAWIKDEVALNGKASCSVHKKFDISQLSVENFKTIEWLKIAGGEVFLMPEHTELLDFLVSNKLAHKIELVYVCNNTVRPSVFKKYWDHFKIIRFILSIDGTEEVNEYIRYPSKWDLNLRVIDELFALELTGDKSIEVNSVVSLLNIFHLNRLDEWWSKISNRQPIFYRILDDPQHFRINRLPFDLRKSALQNMHGAKNLDGIMKYLMETDVEEGLENSLEILHQMDRLRGTDFRKINPQFY